MSMLLALTLTFGSTAWAAKPPACLKATQKELADASPLQVPAAWESLRACDAAAAQAALPATLKRTVVGENSSEFAIAAINAGGEAAVRDWVGSLQSDDRARAIAKLGEACGAGDAKVGAFIVNTQAVVGDRFWTEPWYRALTTCRTPEAQKLLNDEVRNRSKERARYFSALEVYAKNLGVAAIPTLSDLVIGTADQEELVNLVSTFAYTTGLGSVEGQNPEATAAAVAAIVQLSPTLPPKVLDQARITLMSLGANAEADQLAGLRYASAKWADGSLHYGLVVVETATCKRGKVREVVHLGEISNPGTTWPETVVAEAESISMGWTYGLAEACKGTASNTVFVTGGPVSPEELAAFHQEQTTAAQAKVVTKREVRAEAAIVRP